MKTLKYREFFLIIISFILVYTQIQAQNGWTLKSYLPTPRVGASAEILNGKIYVLGGNGGPPYFPSLAVNEKYDPIANQWEERQPMGTPRGFFATGVVNDTIYAIGGGYATALDNVEAYDAITNTWSPRANMLNPRLFMRAAVVNGTIYIFGGNYNEHNVQAYDPATNEWTERTPIPSDGGGNLSVCADGNGSIYIFGGSSNSTWSEPWEPLSTVYEYNPTTDVWTKREDMPTPRFGFQTSLVNGKIYALGGSQARNTALATVEAYDPVTDTWETKPDMPFSSFDHATAVFDNKIFLFNGSPDWATSDGAVWEYDPLVVDVDQEYVTPAKFALYQNYPNPFNPTTTIGYVLKDKTNTKLILLNAIGEEVAVLLNGEQEKGFHKVDFNASTLASGVYFYQLRAGDFVQTKKMILLK